MKEFGPRRGTRVPGTPLAPPLHVHKFNLFTDVLIYCSRCDGLGNFGLAIKTNEMSKRSNSINILI